VSPFGALGIAGASIMPASFGGLLGQVALPMVNLRYTFGKSEQESVAEQRKTVAEAMTR
jgi:hypothetical protein